jgi:hypothetical protein
MGVLNSAPIFVASPLIRPFSRGRRKTSASGFTAGSVPSHQGRARGGEGEQEKLNCHPGRATCETRDPELQQSERESWVPALRCASAGMTRGRNAAPHPPLRGTFSRGRRKSARPVFAAGDFVILGFMPRIHLARTTNVRKPMDPRDKPKDDIVCQCSLGRDDKKQCE